MKGIVVYYSATGNTAKIAKAIHRGMKSVMECDIANIRKADPKAMAQYDVIAIGGPIWYFRETANLRLFVNAMPDTKGKLCVPFCVHGSAPIGFFYSLVPALKRKGLTVIGWADWYGSVYQVMHMPKPYLTDGHPDEIDLKEAEAFGREMGGRARRIAVGEKHLIPALPKGPKADLLWRPSQPKKLLGDAVGNMPPAPRQVRTINMEKCLYPKCTICMDNCLMHCIDFSVSPPVIKGSCVNDSLCERICPTGAIEVDAATRSQRPQRVIDMKKCKYPECTLCIDHCPMDSIDFSVNPPAIRSNCEHDDLCWVICPEGAIDVVNVERAHAPKAIRDLKHPFARLLDEAEAQGRFRRHVPMEKIGWDTPIYKNPDHPRFVIEEDD